MFWKSLFQSSSESTAEGLLLNENLTTYFRPHHNVLNKILQSNAQAKAACDADQSCSEHLEQYVKVLAFKEKLKSHYLRFQVDDILNTVCIT